MANRRRNSPPGGHNLKIRKKLNSALYGPRSGPGVERSDTAVRPAKAPGFGGRLAAQKEVFISAGLRLLEPCEGAECRAGEPLTAGSRIVAGERFLAGKISNTMFSGSDERYDVSGAKVHPKVMMCTFRTEICCVFWAENGYGSEAVRSLYGIRHLGR